jgi:hypothetical protein
MFFNKVKPQTSKSLSAEKLYPFGQPLSELQYTKACTNKMFPLLLQRHHQISSYHIDIPDSEYVTGRNENNQLRNKETKCFFSYV